MKSGLTKLIEVAAVLFLMIALLSYGFGWPNTGIIVYAAWDVPPRLVPVASFDLYTQKDGIGPYISGGTFVPGEVVVLCVKVTSNDLPVENRTITFEITGPTHFSLNISFLQTAVTDSSGIAYQVFSLPSADNAPETVLGTWTATAQTGLDQETLGDTLEFEVVPASMQTSQSACTSVRATFKAFR